MPELWQLMFNDFSYQQAHPSTLVDMYSKTCNQCVASFEVVRNREGRTIVVTHPNGSTRSIAIGAES